MKKLFFFLALLSIALTAKSQFGVKAGANYFNLMGEGVEDTKMLLSFHAGVVYNIKISKLFSIRPEVFYSGQGAKEDPSINGDAKALFGYLNFTPVLVLTTRVKVFVETGPQLGLLLSAKYKDGNASVDVKDELKGSDFAWLFGLGYLVNPNLAIDVRANLGLTSISSDPDEEIKNIGLGLGLIYYFGLGKK